jgi:hypothetical protein
VAWLGWVVVVGGGHFVIVRISRFEIYNIIKYLRF